MLKDLLDPVFVNRSLNALLLLFIGVFFWSWLGNTLGLPMHIILGVSAVAITIDISNYSEDPKPGALLIGGLVLPFWLLLRVWRSDSGN
tara:strand:+ start:3261 stop:3527 length:267 start_codon:yes stop_codon:yes gene_type:complete